MSLQTVGLLWLIVFALALAAIAAINLHAADPRSRGIQLASFLVLLLLITAAYEAVGTWGWALLLSVVAAAELIRLVRRRRRRVT